MPSGTVKWFNTTKGYGFIAPDDGGSDIFVHISAVEQSGMTGLADDQKVTFDLIEGRDGRKMAGNIAKARVQSQTACAAVSQPNVQRVPSVMTGRAMSAGWSAS